MTSKPNSTYQRKNGVVMKQINLAVREDIADKFDMICDGVSKSAIFTQWVNEKAREQLLVQPAHEVKEKTSYSILDGE